MAAAARVVSAEMFADAMTADSVATGACGSSVLVAEAMTSSELLGRLASDGGTVGALVMVGSEMMVTGPLSAGCPQLLQKPVPAWRLDPQFVQKALGEEGAVSVADGAAAITETACATGAG